MAYTINNAMSFLKARLFRMRAKILLFSKKGGVGSKATYDFFPEDIWPRIKGGRTTAGFTSPKPCATAGLHKNFNFSLEKLYPPLLQLTGQC